MRILAVTIPFLLVCGAASPQAPRPETKFVLEISCANKPGPDYIMLGSSQGSSLFFEGGLSRIVGRDPQLREPTALRLAHKIEGNVVLMTVSVLFGDYDSDNPPPSLDHLPSQQLGSYSAGLHQSVTLSEMKEFGLEPFTVKILPPQPPVSTRPLTTSNAPSVGIRIAGQDWLFYDVELLNHSDKTVTAIDVRMPADNGGSGGGVGGDPKGIIAPGETYQFQFSIPRSWTESNGEFVKNPIPPVLVLEAVEFHDGSYEGNVELAMEMAARRICSESQKQRINELVEAILADGQSDEDAKLERIRSEVAQLAETPDPQSVERLRSQFPGLSGKIPQPVDIELRSALDSEKRSVASYLESFQRARAVRPSYTFAQWWSILRTR